MLDPSYIRDHIEEVRVGLRNRGLDPDKVLEEIATLETARRRVLPELEALKRAQNTSGDEIARAKRQGHDTGYKLGFLKAVVYFALRRPDLADKFGEYLTGLRINAPAGKR